MRWSRERVLTTHCGSLARPAGLLDLMRSREGGQEVDEGVYAVAVEAAVAECVQRQVETGIDIVSDGEQGKVGHAIYILERLSGFAPSERRLPSLFAAEEQAFPEYYREYFDVAMLGGGVASRGHLACQGEVKYCGTEAVRRDIEVVKAAVPSGWDGEVFMAAIAPSGAGPNEYYDTEQEYLFAVAEALKTEYRAIVDAGLLLQIDDPFLTEVYSYSEGSEQERRRRCEAYVEAINYALEGIPEEEVRFHTCYGINQGPRTHDAGFGELVEFVLRVKAGAYSFEAANPRHEHEYRIWDELELPEGKALIPGVVSHTTTVVEHPELVAQRIERYARRVGRERVIAGADCGFSSQASYRPEIHPRIVWAKFEALCEGAQLASRALWGGRAA